MIIPKKKYPLVLSMVCLLSLSAVAQKLENLKAVAQENSILITYDIVQGQVDDSYTVNLYSSHNNFTSPLKSVTGDIGQAVKKGVGKKITWASKDELGAYKGELTFEVRAEVVAAFAFVTQPASARRGKTVPLSWRGGDKRQEVKIELLNAGKVTQTLSTLANEGGYQWTIPAKQQTGSNYQIRLHNGKQTVTTNTFPIKHKIPFIIKVLPLVAVGALIGLTGGKKDAGNGGNTNTSGLADPPNITN